MVALQIVAGVLIFLLLLLIIPLRLRACFYGELKVKLRYLFFSYTLYPRPLKREEKSKRRAEKKAEKDKEKQKELSHAEELLKSEGVAAVVSYYAQIARLMKAAAAKLIRAITVDRLKLDVVVATDDAAETAIDYGRVCAVVYPAQALLESMTRVRRRFIAITPDFMGQKGRVSGEIRIHALPLRILWVLLLFFIGYIGNTISYKKTEQN